MLCSWGRHISSEVVQKFGLMTRLLTFMSYEPTEVALPLTEALKLSVSAHELFSVLLGFGIQQAQESFLSFLPLLIRQLHFYRDKVNVNEDTGSNELNFDLGSHLVTSVRRALSIAATQSMLETQMKQHSSLRGGIGDKPGEVLQPPILAWESVAPLGQLINTCTMKWLTQIQRSPTTHAGLSLLGSACLFTENYFRKSKDQKSCSGPQLLIGIEEFYGKALSPFLKSDSVGDLLSRLKSHSPLCSNLTQSNAEDARNLASLNCISMEGKVTPIILPSSPFALLTPLSKLLVTMTQLHPSLPSESLECFITNPSLLGYLQALSAAPLALRSQWFTRIEADFVTHILLLSGSLNIKDRKVYHCVALDIIACLQKGQEHVARNLITDVICNEKFVEDLTELASEVHKLALDDYEPLKSPALFQPCLRPSILTKKIG